MPLNASVYFRPAPEPGVGPGVVTASDTGSVSSATGGRNKTGPGWNHFSLLAKASRNQSWLL